MGRRVWWMLGLAAGLVLWFGPQASAGSRTVVGEGSSVTIVVQGEGTQTSVYRSGSGEGTVSVSSSSAPRSASVASPRPPSSSPARPDTNSSVSTRRSSDPKSHPLPEGLSLLQELRSAMDKVEEELSEPERAQAFFERFRAALDEAEALSLRHLAPPGPRDPENERFLNERFFTLEELNHVPRRIFTREEFERELNRGPRIGRIDLLLDEPIQEFEGREDGPNNQIFGDFFFVDRAQDFATVPEEQAAGPPVLPPIGERIRTPFGVQIPPLPDPVPEEQPADRPLLPPIGEGFSTPFPPLQDLQAPGPPPGQPLTGEEALRKLIGETFTVRELLVAPRIILQEEAEE